MTKVLIVEDEDNYRQFLKKVVERKYPCETASDGYEARKIIQKGNYDIVIHDLRLPGIQGKDLIHFIRNDIDKDIINIVITGYENDWNPIEATGEDIFYYFKKGEFKPEDLLKILENAEKIRKIRMDEKKNINKLINEEKKSYFSKLAISIAHEINNPLQSMMLITHMLRENLSELEPKNKKSLSEEIDILEKSIERIKQTVELIINFNRDNFEEGEKTDIQWIINQAISFIRPIAKEKGIKINKPVIQNSSNLRKLNSSHLFAFLYLLLEIVDFNIQDISIFAKRENETCFIKIICNLKKNTSKDTSYDRKTGDIEKDTSISSSLKIFKKLGTGISFKKTEDKVTILIKH